MIAASGNRNKYGPRGVNTCEANISAFVFNMCLKNKRYLYYNWQMPLSKNPSDQ